MTVKYCKYCGIEHGIPGFACRVCKNGLYRYGMTRLDMIALHEKQGKKCAVCKKEIKLFLDRKGGFIDHCHLTGKVRGILCMPCNTMLGTIETKNLLESINSYLVPVAQGKEQ